ILGCGLEAAAYTFISGSDSSLPYQMLASRKMQDQYLKINSRILAAQSAVMGRAIFIGAQLAQYSWNLPYLLTMLILIVAAGFMCRVKDLMPFAEREKSTGKLIKTLKDNILYRDRKSTRLNSSHVSISYAVFCLKKKNNNTTCSIPTYRKNFAIVDIEEG